MARGSRVNDGWTADRKDFAEISGWGKIFFSCGVVSGSFGPMWWASVAWEGALETASPGLDEETACSAPSLVAFLDCFWRIWGTLRSWTCRSNSAHVHRCLLASSSCLCQRACYNSDKLFPLTRSPVVVVTRRGLQQEWGMLILFWLARTHCWYMSYACRASCRRSVHGNRFTF